MPYTIDDATPADYAAMADVNVCAYEEFAHALPPGAWDRMQGSLTDIATRAQREHFYVARSESGLGGSVAYCPAGKSDPLYFSADMASVMLLAVHPAHRGRGVARQLMATCIARARAEQATILSLFTTDLMQPAQALYRSMGFRLDAELVERHGIRSERFVLSLRGDEAQSG